MDARRYGIYLRVLKNRYRASKRAQRTSEISISTRDFVLFCLLYKQKTAFVYYSLKYAIL